MRTSCHSCESNYEIPDERVGGARAASELLIRCPNCRAIMVVGTSSSPAFPQFEFTPEVTPAVAALAEMPTKPEGLPVSMIRERIAQDQFPGVQNEKTVDLRAMATVERRRVKRTKLAASTAARVTSDAVTSQSITSDERSPQVTRERPVVAQRPVVAARPVVAQRALVEQPPQQWEAPVPLTVIKRPSRRRELNAFAFGFLAVSLIWVAALYTIPAVLL